MKKKKIARVSATVLATVMALTGIGLTSFAANGLQVKVQSDSQTQMSSELEVVYANNYNNTNIRTQNFDDNWKFYLGDAGDAQANAFDDSKWDNISIPHDYSIQQDYTTALDAESGYLSGGTGWYRKHFVVGEEFAGKELRLDFDGVYMNATVYINGEKLGTHPFGYTPFSFDITDKVKVGEENVVAVKVEHKTPSSRWYSGSGIYRSVNLSVMDKVHIGLNGTKVETPKLESEKGNNVTTNVKTTVLNESKEATDVVLTHTIYKKGTKESIGTSTTNAKNIPAGTEAVIDANVQAKNPTLWSPENPALYTIHTEVKVGNKVVDTYDTEYGFRYFSMDKDHGAFLNGNKIKLKGVCMHHDQGALGAAAYRRAIERQVDILKEMGCNSIRVTHNPAASALIEICNEKGMLVIDEMFDGWQHAKNNNNNDYSVWFNKQIESGNTIIGKKDNMTWAEFDLKAAINRGKNAPSIIMWSLGNEIQEGTGGKTGFEQKAPDLIRWAQEADSTRMVTIGSNAVKGAATGEHANIADLLTKAGGASGTNYSKDKQYDEAHKAHPTWKIYGSETASSINSRGVYYHKGTGGRYEKTRQLTSYDKSKVGWGALASEAWYDVITRDFVAGEYVWTGFDYIGEPTPWNGTYPGEMDTNNFETNPKNSYFGIIDTAGFPKDSYYFYQSQWNDKVNTLHVLPTWNKDGLVVDNKGNVEVVVYSDAAKVELKLNGKSLGTKEFETKTTEDGYTYKKVKGTRDSHENLYMTWEVPYEEGILEAIAYDESGKKIEKTQGRSVVKTAEKEANLSVTADRKEIAADGKDLSYITVDVTDAKGNIVPDADDRVKFTVKGDGVLVGVDNGSSPDHDSYKADNRRAFSGKVLAIVKSTKKAGEFTVTASAEGLKSSEIKVKTTPVKSDVVEKQVDSYYMSKNYYVKANVEPKLADTIEVRYSDGTKASKKVTWDKIPADKLTKTGTFIVKGIVENAGKVSVNVNVIDEIGGMLNYSATTPLGKKPVLPERRPVVLANGEVLTTTFEVKWDEPKDEVYNKEQTVVVKGKANVLGQELPVTASIRVQKAQFDIGSSVSKDAAEVKQNCKKTSDTLAAINDGNTKYQAVGENQPNPSLWSNYDNSQGEDGVNKAELTFRYDTTFALGEVVIHFAKDSWSARYPDAGKTEIYVSASGEANSWIKVEANETMGQEVAGPVANTGVKPYKYSFSSPYGATFVKICLTNKEENLGNRKPCIAITEIELKKANEKFVTNATAKLESLTLNGEALSNDVLEKGTYSTPALVANIENVKGADNAAVTVLPEYKEVVRVIIESEDHATRNVFEIKLNQEANQKPDSSNLDYPISKLKGRVIAGNELPNPTQNEGSKEYVIDGKADTHWHTDWSNGNPDTPLEKRWIGFNFEKPVKIDALRYLPRTKDGNNGSVTEYKVEYKATDDADWKVAPILKPDGSTEETGTWDKEDSSWKLAAFEPITVKQVRLVGVHTWLDSKPDKHMAAAELRARTVKETIDISKPENGIKVEVLGLNDKGEIEVPVVNAENPVKPAVKVTDKEGNILKWGIDYKVRYENNTEFSANGSKARLIVEGMIDYSGKVSKEFTITKAPKQISSIFVKQNPKKNYLVGEKFSPAGLILTLVYNDKTEEEIAYSEATAKDFAFNPTLDKSLTETDKQVVVTYAGKSVKIDITVSPASKPSPDKPNKPNSDKTEGGSSNNGHHNGQSQNTTTNSHSVKTGDSTNVVIPIATMIVAVIGIGAVVILKRKRR